MYGIVSPLAVLTAAPRIANDTGLHFAGSKAPAQLSQGTKDWVAAKRLDLKNLMWANAGILRRTKDMTAALQRLNALSFEAQASRPCPPCIIAYPRLLPSLEVQEWGTALT